MTKQCHYPAFLLIVLLVVIGFSVYHPYRWNNWLAEMVPILFLTILLVITYKKFQFSLLAYAFMFLGLVLHTIGAKYSFALVPIDLFDEGRNHYDRVGHFVAGFWAVTA